MQKWDYLYLSLNGKQQVASARAGGQPYSIPGKSLFAGADLSTTLALLGEDGWELAATLSGYVPSVLLFKRPKP